MTAPIKKQLVVKTYRGTQETAAKQFEWDAAKMAAQGYQPVSQAYLPGTWGAGSFILALLLCVVLIGIVVFVYMLLVKPHGTLSVTYELRAAAPEPVAEKVCPMCAESIKAAAVVCRFCNHQFA